MINSATIIKWHLQFINNFFKRDKDSYKPWVFHVYQEEESQHRVGNDWFRRLVWIVVLSPANMYHSPSHPLGSYSEQKIKNSVEVYLSKYPVLNIPKVLKIQGSKDSKYLKIKKF